MPWYSILALALSSFTILGVLAGVFWANMRNKYATTTKENYENAVESYKEVVKGQNAKIQQQSDQIDQLRIDHNTNMKEIGYLQGELKSYKQLPLKELSENLMVVTKLTTLIAAHLKIDGIGEIVADKGIWNDKGRKQTKG